MLTSRITERVDSRVPRSMETGYRGHRNRNPPGYFLNSCGATRHRCNTGGYFLAIQSSIATSRNGRPPLQLNGLRYTSNAGGALISNPDNVTQNMTKHFGYSPSLQGAVVACCLVHPFQKPTPQQSCPDCTLPYIAMESSSTMPTQVSSTMEQDAPTTNENPSVIWNGGSEPAKENETWQLARFVPYVPVGRFSSELGRFIADTLKSSVADLRKDEEARMHQ